jgi:aldose 1-epimerase
MAASPVNGKYLLEAHGFACDLDPAQGGLVTALTWCAPDERVVPLLFGQGDAIASRAHPNMFGLWPLVPFANRAYGGVIDDGIDAFTVPQNDPATGSAIHGFGLQSIWDVTKHGSDRMVMQHDKVLEPASGPYAYRSTLTVSLRSDHARIELAVVNRSARTLPFGLGLHPWFPRHADTLVLARAKATLSFHPGGYKASCVTQCEGGGAFALPSPITSGTAQSMIGWEGQAIISSRENGLGITIDASENARHPVLWAPPVSDFVCFEPQSHAIGSPSEVIARKAAPLTRLEPGQAMSIWMTITPSVI